MFHNRIHSRKTMWGLCRFIDLSLKKYTTFFKHDEKIFSWFSISWFSIFVEIRQSDVYDDIALLSVRSLYWTEFERMLFVAPRVQEPWCVEMGSKPFSRTQQEVERRNVDGKEKVTELEIVVTGG